MKVKLSNSSRPWWRRIKHGGIEPSGAIRMHTPVGVKKLDRLRSSTLQQSSEEIQINAVEQNNAAETKEGPSRIAIKDMTVLSTLSGKVVKNSLMTGSDSETDLDRLIKQIRPGTLLWAKVVGFPHWPSFVHGPNPDDPFIRGPEGGDAGSKEVHVFFFDQGNLRLSNWVKIRNVKLFSEVNPNRSVKAHIRKRLEYSINEAKKASALDPEMLVKEYYINDFERDNIQVLYVVENILGKRQEPGRRVEYLIKWKGYPEVYNSWEPMCNIGCPELLLAFERDRREAAKKAEESNPDPQKKNTAFDLLTDEEILLKIKVECMGGGEEPEEMVQSQL